MPAYRTCEVCGYDDAESYPHGCVACAQRRIEELEAEVERLQAAVALEREACALVADGRADKEAENPWCLDITHESACRDIAAAIRARANP